MSDLALADGRIPAMSHRAIEQTRDLEKALRALPQEVLTTHHVLHGGVYARTIKIRAGVALVGVRITVPTTLIFDGDAYVNAGEGMQRISGHHVLAASAGRRQAFRALNDTFLTMVLATSAKTIAEAEEQFTDEVHLLASRSDAAINRYVITGE